MPRIIPNVLIRHDPVADAVPVVFDSPHSGAVYPPDFDFAAPFAVMRRAEDAFVDELFESAPRHGAGLLAALFPRSYVDPNRHEHDVDPKLLAEPWPDPVVASDHGRRGLGVVRRLVRSTVPVYGRRLSIAEVQARLSSYHRPYHLELRSMIDAAHARFGAVWHINCHSMKSTAKGHPRADFVLGDRHGTTCESEFTEFVATTLRDLGYSVALNHPFKGAELVARHGDPAGGRHSLQIEINRGLYMDEERIERSPGFAPLQTDIDRLIAATARYVGKAIATRTAPPGFVPRDCAPDRTADGA
ncbi:MAG TPA: N-formylglutamate amidohydrolase [Methylomirabilota bacterium]|nr:N-formylglutamate amidohydrolase [Methylomirabilota bacterium]